MSPAAAESESESESESEEEEEEEEEEEGSDGKEAQSGRASSEDEPAQLDDATLAVLERWSGFRVRGLRV